MAETALASGCRHDSLSSRLFDTMQIEINLQNMPISFKVDNTSSTEEVDSVSIPGCIKLEIGFSGGSRKFWWVGILSTKPQTFGCLHQN